MAPRSPGQNETFRNMLFHFFSGKTDFCQKFKLFEHFSSENWKVVKGPRLVNPVLLSD